MKSFQKLGVFVKNKGTFHRHSRGAFHSLKVTAHLQCGVIDDGFLPLDGILYYYAMRERYGPQVSTQPGQDHEVRVTGVSLPILRVNEHGPLWFYAASFAQWGIVAEGKEYWNKRFDFSAASLVGFGNKKAKVDIASSEYKAYHMPVFYRHSPTVSWFIECEPEWLSGLLPHITHLGKKTSQGWGAISRWEIEPQKQDFSVYGPAGELMRSVPSEVGGILYGFRPSYWLPKNQARCALPIQKGK
jgi:CRISPR type IV-associated protein Csf3